MHVTRLTQFFQLRIPIAKTLPFLFLQNANLTPDFQSASLLEKYPSLPHVSWYDRDDIRGTTDYTCTNVQETSTSTTKWKLQ